MVLTGRGTRDYRSPELIEQNLNDPFAADIYSLGIIMFIFMFDAFPFDEKDQEVNSFRWIFENDVNVFFNVHAKHGLKRKVPTSFKSLFASMVRRDPTKRATIEDVVRNEWYNQPIYSKEELKNIMSARLGKNN